MQPSKNSELSRADFDEFINVFTHEIRNRLNAVSLEVADLSEQGGINAARLEQRVRDCAAYLKTVRELVTPDDPAAEKRSLTEIVAMLRARPSA
jgi:hypothetical protein